MSSEYIEEIVDLAEYPEVSERAGKQTEVTIGDLHGNGFKFLYFLIREGVLQISKDQYEEFFRIYKKDVTDITKLDILNLNLMLTLAEVNPDPPKIRIMGDEVFDRGSNDYFVLKLFEKLGESHVPLEIIASNHGFEYLSAAEKNLPEITTDKAVFLAGGTPFRRSYANLIALKNKFGDELGDLMEITNKFYKPNLKMLSYTLDEERNAITLYTHAPVFIDTIIEVAEKFSKILEDDINEAVQALEIAKSFVDFAQGEEKARMEEEINIHQSRLERLRNIKFEKATSAKALAEMIDSINAVFAYHVEENRTTDLFSQDTENDPVFRMIWNRYEERNEYELFDKLPFTVLCVHGHDNQGYILPGTEGYVINLDNILGKDSPNEINTKGYYTILSTSPAMLLEEQLSDETLSENETSEDDLSQNELSAEDVADNTADLTEIPVATIYLADTRAMPYLKDVVTDNFTVINFMMNHDIENIQKENNVTILLWDNKPVFKIYDDHICLMNSGDQAEALQKLLPAFVDLLTAIANDHDKDNEIISVSAQTSEVKESLENLLSKQGHIVELDNKKLDLLQTQTRIVEPLIDDSNAPPSRPPPSRPISPK